MFATRDCRSRTREGAALGLVAVVFLTPASMACAQISVRATFQQARESYNRGSYSEVVDQLEPLVGAELPVRAMRDDPVLVRESRKYLGAAYVLMSQREDAVRQFEALLRAEGEDLARYQLNAAVFPSSVQEVFDEVQARLVAEQVARREALEVQEAERERARRDALMTLYQMAQEDEVEVENVPYMPFIPFGAGQFHNGNETLGWFFALSEAVACATATLSLVSYLSLLEEREQILLGSISGDLPGLNNALTALTVVNWVSVGGAAVLMIAGLVEALFSYRPTRTLRRRREVPQETLDRLQLVGGPNGMGLGLRF